MEPSFPQYAQVALIMSLVIFVVAIGWEFVKGIMKK